MGYCGELRANTAVDILIGPFVDDDDGFTAKTGLTIDVEVSKNGQALANKNDATAPTDDAAGDIDGYYNCELDTTDTNTEGMLTVVCLATDALPVRHDFMVLAEAAWDSKYVAKDDGFMDVNVKTVGRADTQETEANNLESACANYSATRGLTGTALPAAAANAAGGVPVSVVGGLDLDAKLANTNEVTAARMGALTDLIDGGRLDLLIDAILLDTGTTLDGKENQIIAAVITNAAGADVAADIIAVKAETAELKAAVITNAAGVDIAADIAAVAAAIVVIDDFLDTEVAAILAAVDTEVASIKTKTDLLPSGVKKNTELANFEFLMVDSADHVTGVALLAVTATRSIDGGAFGACANAVAEVANGLYKITLAAADLNGDFVTLRFTAAGADDTVIGIKTQA